MGVLDHVQCQRHLVDVGGHADHVQHAFRRRQDVRLVIALFGVGHGRQLQRGIVVADNAADVLLAAVLPRSKLARRELLPRVDVADLHVVDSGLDAGLIHASDYVVSELVVVHQAAIADCDIDDLDFLPVPEPIVGPSRAVFLAHFSLLFMCNSSIDERIYTAAQPAKGQTPAVGMRRQRIRR